ncbi:MAG: cation diffusion facilitator family transporter [Chloroflexales bacterium]|jgi:cation diffusion facilitator family transporter
MTYLEPHAHLSGHDHDHDHDHHDHDHHDHDHSGWLSRIAHLLPFSHSHAAEDKIDAALESSELGIWALKVSLVGLGATAIFQLVIVLLSGSVALMADTIHNLGDALTAVPLWVAFVLGRRAATRRYTYGFGRAEDVAGILIVLTILTSALIAGYESYRRLIDPQPISHVGWVITAAIVGFIGNELVAIFRIRIGTQIGSAALIADGQHARVDGFTSLAVLVGALGSLAGYPLVDPIIGLLITVALVVIVKDTAVTMWHRLMDAVDPAVVAEIEHAAGHVSGVESVAQVRARWVGHRLHADLHITVDADLPTHVSHRIANDVRHALHHAQPRLAATEIYTQPCGHRQ